MRRFAYVVQTVLGLLFRHPLLGVCLIPILEDGQIVLVKRRDNGCWSLPGGMVDWGEQIQDSISRELTEETGLTLERIGRCVGVYSDPYRDPRVHSICLTFEIHVQGELKVHDIHEIAEANVFALDQAAQMPLSHDHTQQLADYLQGQWVIR
ncbi:NUDIX hydrolase [Acaryochloris sp. IP29b_bin.148]|uniref:NUDIX hydrolase n=1 Tax=Acaryochloris sp. IP29b_bin.148 TaxID=2969218 RepID=UPI0026162BB9|nr:NUDIX hydrolase [Acaryochloris sp. IP29b_bin.148]